MDAALAFSPAPLLLLSLATAALIMLRTLGAGMA